MKYRWLLPRPEHPHVIAALCAQLNDLPPALGMALSLRGIETYEDARRFFRPSLNDLHDPFLMLDMDVAAERLEKAILQGEKVVVYGDYDVDGTTATALMVNFLRQHGLDAEFFIPDRYTDGYGLCYRGIDFAAFRGATLMIALDCGITGHAAADYCREKGIDLVVCDHHNAEEAIPDALAVLDPKRPDCPYPFKELTGCGVGFKLIQATLSKLGSPPEDAWEYLDLVALAIASDIVPILGENRLLMYEGLRRIQTNPRIGLRMLALQGGQDLASCSTSQIVFGLGPRINAAGRMGDAAEAVELLVATNPDRALKQAQRLEKLNGERRLMDSKTFEEAVYLMESRASTCMQHAIVLHHPGWHLGVIGIVASRLVERFYRPTVLLTTANGMAKGSARSVPGYNIYDAIRSCDHLLAKFGGHAFAAGLTLPVAHLETFTEQLNEVVSQTIQPNQLKAEIVVDAPLSLQDITPRFKQILEQFGPFGPQNRQPIFMGTGVQVKSQPTLVGRDGHLKFQVQQGHNGQASPTFDVIGFGLHALYPTVRESLQYGRALDMLFTIDENNFMGQTSFQLRAKDLKLAG
ncbi:MAG TPA: single-stranded-DNA-specific exonuclease RecJ [Rhodothermales bacterium]|nr:single-stranded-DNA-specific exonuclease RecJ [Rhodothermales bacterium]